MITSRKHKSFDTHESATPFQSLTVIKKLSSTKFPVLLVHSKINGQYYAMKMFHYVDDHPHDYFHNEVRFTFLKHPNIVNFLHYQKTRKSLQDDKLKRVSCIFMEYASHGDFFHFIINHRDHIDEKLARTYFRQLMDGIEYLHENGIAHLDLKPENLLLGDDFTLKIIDFDRSYMQGDSKILSKGTKYYRAPEFFRPNFSNTALENLFAADIYGAGIILFVLRTGGTYPHAEDNGLESGSFVDLMYKDNERFWKKHQKLEEREENLFDCDFKELFNQMTAEKPCDRINVKKQIKLSKWYNGPIYSSIDLQTKMKELLNFPSPLLTEKDVNR